MTHKLAKDPQGNDACTTRGRYALGIFVTGLTFMALDLFLNGGNSLDVLAAYTGSGPTLYFAGRANHEIQVRKLGA